MLSGTKGRPVLRRGTHAPIFGEAIGRTGHLGCTADYIFSSAAIGKPNQLLCPSIPPKDLWSPAVPAGPVLQRITVPPTNNNSTKSGTMLVCNL